MQHHPVRSRKPRLSRQGFTLLEIVLGMAIFFGSLAIFSQILWNGSRAAVQGQLRAQALVRCEAKLGEVVAGATPFQTQQNQSFSSDPIDDGWNWTVEIEPTDHPNLNAVVVTVDHAGNSDLANASVQLRRWMRDPAQMALVAQEAAVQAKENEEKKEEAAAVAANEAAEASGKGKSGNSSPTGTGKTDKGFGAGNVGGGTGKGGGPGGGAGGPGGGGGPKGGGGGPGGGPKGGGGGPKGGGGGGGPQGGGGGPQGGGGNGLPPGFPPNFPPDLIPPGGFPPGLFPPGFFPPGSTPKGG